MAISRQLIFLLSLNNVDNIQIFFSQPNQTCKRHCPQVMKVVQGYNPYNTSVTGCDLYLKIFFLFFINSINVFHQAADEDSSYAALPAATRHNSSPHTRHQLTLVTKWPHFSLQGYGTLCCLPKAKTESRKIVRLREWH